MSYQYKPLLLSDSFRLLLLQPSSSCDSNLEGSLLNTTLAECDYDLIHPFTALSYVWGKPEKPCSISIDGNMFPITKSLNDALRDLRDATHVRKVWADALCINQESIPERNSQVSMMGRIYSTAHSTIIHLGELTDTVDEVFNKALSETASEGCLEYPLPEACRGPNMVAAPSSPILLGVRVVRIDAEEIFEQASRGILHKEWFKRVWVLQELALSKDPWVQCGNRRVRWDKLCYLLVGNHELSPIFETRPKVITAHLDLLRGMDVIRNTYVDLPLYRAVQTRRGFGATDPRDLVYANFDVINDLEHVNKYLHVDYDKSTQWVFSRVALYIFKYGSLDGPEWFISLVDGVPANQRIHGLPSWAPD